MSDETQAPCSLDEKIGISLLMLASFNTATLRPGHRDLNEHWYVWACVLNIHSHTQTLVSLKGSLVWRWPRLCCDILPPVDRALLSPLRHTYMCAWACDGSVWIGSEVNLPVGPAMYIWKSVSELKKKILVTTVKEIYTMHYWGISCPNLALSSGF